LDPDEDHIKANCRRWVIDCPEKVVEDPLSSSNDYYLKQNAELDVQTTCAGVSGTDFNNWACDAISGPKNVGPFTSGWTKEQIVQHCRKWDCTNCASRKMTENPASEYTMRADVAASKKAKHCGWSS
jgi:hypothetical protein